MADSSLTRAIRVQGIDEFLAGPDLEWHIDDVLPAGGIGAVIGPSGSGKTHAVLDVALTTSSGLSSWLGNHRIKAGRVVYLIAEGRPGLRNRIRAWRRAHPGVTPELFIIPEAVQLMDAGDVAGMIAAIVSVAGPNIALLILDTWTKITPGADENSRSEMGVALAAADRLRDTFDCTVIIVHHTGGNPEKSETPRGSTAFLAHMDWVWLVQAKDGLRTVKCVKMRDAEEFAPFQFRLRAMDPSCVIEPVAFDAVAAIAAGLDRSARTALAVLEGRVTGLSATDWKAASGLASSTFYSARKALTELDLVRPTGNLYAVTEASTTPTPTLLQRDSNGSKSSTPLLQHSFRSGSTGVTENQTAGVPGLLSDDAIERLAIEEEVA